MNGEAPFSMEHLRHGLPGVSPEIYSDEDFSRISALVLREAGIALPSGKKLLVYSRLASLVRKTGVVTFSAFLERAAKDPAVRAEAVDALTTNHTFFNREGHHFEHFSRDVRPRLCDSLNNGGQVRIWSAGCSSGEEAWDVAMAMLGDCRKEGDAIAKQNIRILASDLAKDVLTVARSAVYPSEQLNCVAPNLRDVWTRSDGANTTIEPMLRSIVRFRQLNLLNSWPITGPFDAIFCRNVVIYFDRATREELFSRMADVLAPGGCLYVGHSERVSGSALKMFDTIAPTIYRKVAS